jgi:hypothetical protein
MSFLGHKIQAPEITDVNRIPDEWFLDIADLNKDKCKRYMDEGQRKKMLFNMVTNMVDELTIQRQKEKCKGEETQTKSKRHTGTSAPDDEKATQ